MSPFLRDRAAANVDSLRQLGVPILGGFDVFRLRPAYDMLHLPDPGLIFINGLMLMHSAEDHGDSQYSFFVDFGERYGREARDMFFAVGMDAITAQFPNSQVLFLQHTPNVGWISTAAWHSPPAVLRLGARRNAGDLMLENWKYGPDGTTQDMAGAYQAVLCGTEVTKRASPFVYDATEARPFDELDVFSMVQAALHTGPVLCLASNLFTNQLALAQFILQSASPQVPYPPLGQLPTQMRRLAYGGQSYCLTYDELEHTFPEESVLTLAAWWFEGGPAGRHGPLAHCD